MLWKNTIEAAQNRTWLSVEDVFEEGTVIMGRDPLPDKTLEEIRDIVDQITKTQDLVAVFAAASNKFWWVEEDEYDYEEGTEEYKMACAITDAWGDLMDSLEERVIQRAKEERLMAEDEEHPYSIVALTPIMEMYGFRDGRGWWVPIKSEHKDKE